MRPGVLLVKASLRWLARVLMALDLPEFDLPTNATSADEGNVKSVSLAAVMKKAARCRNDMMNFFSDCPEGIRIGPDRIAGCVGWLSLTVEYRV